MTDKLTELIDKAKTVRTSDKDREEQRRSFAFGNANIENARVTRETIDAEADKLKESK